MVSDCFSRITQTLPLMLQAATSETMCFTNHPLSRYSFSFFSRSSNMMILILCLIIVLISLEFANDCFVESGVLAHDDDGDDL